jgi:hypothetical protein
MIKPMLNRIKKLKIENWAYSEKSTTKSVIAIPRTREKRSDNLQEIASSASLLRNDETTFRSGLKFEILFLILTLD